MFPYAVQDATYFYLVVDINSQLGVQLFNRTSSAFEVLTGVLADLQVVAPDVSDSSQWETRSGQPFEFTITLINLGEAPITGTIKWYMTVFLSTDALVDPFDIRLLTVDMTDNIAVNATWQSPIAVFIPYDLPTTRFYLIIGG